MTAMSGCRIDFNEMWTNTLCYFSYIIHFVSIVALHSSHIFLHEKYRFSSYGLRSITDSRLTINNNNFLCVAMSFVWPEQNTAPLFGPDLYCLLVEELNVTSHSHTVERTSLSHRCATLLWKQVAMERMKSRRICAAIEAINLNHVPCVIALSITERNLSEIQNRMIN